MTIDEESSLFQITVLFLRTYWFRVLAISLLLPIPCFWHRRIQAGDLASHVYNAWLAQLIQRGQAPGLHFVRQWNNVLFDALLLKVGNIFGLAVAEKIVVSACVLVFFWGAFALVAAVTQRLPWIFLPCLAMLAYGWTFNIGFFNYYVSLGFAFFALAAAWRGRARDLPLICTLALPALVAHPQGFLWLLGCMGYLWMWRSLRGVARIAPFAISVVVLFAVRFYIFHHYEAYSVWQDFGPGFYGGNDQIALYSTASRALSLVALLFGIACLVSDGWRREKPGESWLALRLALELYVIAVLATYILPDSMRLPIYRGWIGACALRLTSISAVMGVCLLASVKPRSWHIVGFSIIAIAFFSLLYRDTGVLDRMEQQALRLVSTLPPGSRVMATIWAPSASRLPYIVHMVDRTCVGKCFSYENYEISSGEFRVRIAGASPLVTADPDNAQAMETGEYIVKPSDLPVAQIYQCNERDLSLLCIRSLQAGEQNNRLGYHPPDQ